MPLENLAEESLEKNPNLELAQMKFLLARHEPDNDKLKQDLMTAITDQNMAPFYEETCAELGWTLDQGLASKMRTANAAELVRLDAAIEDAEKNLSETEVREAHLAKAEYLSRIGDKAAALAQLNKTYEKTVALGHRLDLLFHLIRLGLFYMDHDLITRNIDRAKSLIELRGDWDRRNRLKVYQGLYCIAVRDFKKAAKLFLSTVSTFTCYELMDYQRFVTYTVIACMISLSRVELLDKVVKGPEILEVMHGIPDISEYVFSLYKCRYAIFFRKLAYVERQLQRDRIWAPHVRYYVREMRILAYTQLLESYRSLTLQYMADTFGVTVSFIDKELARFIADGRLHCKIDKVGGVVETMRPDSKNYQYQACIKQGDILLNRIQKLSRVINI
ncbi:26S proteasome non-ATPase regulatory subunit 6-like [Dermacentor andersoni]|uniref:26S proteasome non-ATPase regulatory subunit 6-like n=1 Tax=Dermacentor andersoni TaxID=34620 RepID=UPI0021554C05|nr:26S proteasome non-ATPase regulatory subunit 6-like [Dermacentor andersoni]